MSAFLSIVWNVDPIMFSLGPVSLRWYSVLFVSGFIIGYYIMKGLCRREKVDENMMDPFLYTMLIATIIGARLGHCLFYQPDYYLGSWQGFWEMFMPWKGGLASHGGAIGLLLACWWFSKHYGKKYHIDFLWIMDRLCLVVCFAGACIRLGNLFNSEIYGNPTDLPWGIIFQRNGETVPKHPTQLYEASAYLLLGFFMLWIYNHKLDKVYRGSLFGIFLIGCFGFRILVEFIKEPQVEFERAMTLDMGQWLSIPFVLAGIVILIMSFKKKVPAKAIIPQRPKKEPTHYAKPLGTA